jgi:hypothetical protein
MKLGSTAFFKRFGFTFSFAGSNKIATSATAVEQENNSSQNESTKNGSLKCNTLFCEAEHWTNAEHGGNTACEQSMVQDFELVSASGASSRVCCETPDPFQSSSTTLVLAEVDSEADVSGASRIALPDQSSCDLGACTSKKLQDGALCKTYICQDLSALPGGIDARDERLNSCSKKENARAAANTPVAKSRDAADAPAKALAAWQADLAPNRCRFPTRLPPLSGISSKGRRMLGISSHVVEAIGEMCVETTASGERATCAQAMRELEVGEAIDTFTPVSKFADPGYPCLNMAN